MKHNKTITKSIVLSEDTYTALVGMAERDHRPVAQMARVIIERAIAEDLKGERHDIQST